MQRLVLVATTVALCLAQAGSPAAQDGGAPKSGPESKARPARAASSERPKSLAISLIAAPKPVQLSYVELTSAEMGLPEDLGGSSSPQGVDREVPGRRIPELTTLSGLAAPELASRAVPLPEANTLADSNYKRRVFGRIRNPDGNTRFFSPQTVLARFHARPYVAALRVEAMRELDSVERLRARADVAFAELDFLQTRQFTPNDTALSNQWHHSVIESFVAWEKGLGSTAVRIAIVDSPFQMDHPDLAANTVAGWSVVSNAVITASSGIAHSTAGAGMAAAVVNNGLGVAGTANCSVLPIHLNGFTSEMYNAVIWAADHDVRVVNISWTGADSPSLNEAGLYLKNRARGLLAMSGVNGIGYLDYPDHPHIYCVSMTDAADNMQSRNGDHIDFSAPGFNVYSTATGSAYAPVSGTSFATPLFCGVVASLLSINPTLFPDEVVDILKTTAQDRGQPGWDRYFGWGRIQFGGAAAVAQSTLPAIRQVVWTNNEAVVTANYRAGLEHSLWKSTQLPSPGWLRVTDAIAVTNGNVIVLTDPKAIGTAAYYQVRTAIGAPPPP